MALLSVLTGTALKSCVLGEPIAEQSIFGTITNGLSTLGIPSNVGCSLGAPFLGGAIMRGSIAGGCILGISTVNISKFAEMVGSDDERNTDANLFDVLPIISQAKSCFQIMCGDLQGALDTQRKFYAKCPIAAQIKSFHEIIDGDIGKAWRTQKDFFAFWFETAVAFAEGIPGVGHVMGALAYIGGNKEYGDQCMKSASRTAGVILGAAVGTFFGGPVGAAAGAVGGGLLMDLIITGVESVVKDQFTPYGYVAALDKVFKGEARSGDVFDLLCGIGVEAGMAYLYAKQSSKVRSVVFDERQLDPEQIRFSQTSVAGEHVDNMTSTMKNNQQKGKMGYTMPSVDVVQMSDGRLTSLDNRRLLAAREAKTPIFARIVEGETPVPNDQLGRFSVNGRNPEVMSEAVQHRIAKQRPASSARANPQGFPDLPRKTYGNAPLSRSNVPLDFLHYHAGPIAEVITAMANILTPRNRPRN